MQCDRIKVCIISPQAVKILHLVHIMSVRWTILLYYNCKGTEHCLQDHLTIETTLARVVEACRDTVVAQNRCQTHQVFELLYLTWTPFWVISQPCTNLAPPFLFCIYKSTAMSWGMSEDLHTNYKLNLSPTNSLISTKLNVLGM